jgi:hypothetical protein
MGKGCLEPRAEETPGSSANGELVGTSTKIARVYLWGSKVLKAVEAGELGCDLGGGEEKPEGFACFFNS